MWVHTQSVPRMEMYLSGKDLWERGTQVGPKIESSLHRRKESRASCTKTQHEREHRGETRRVPGENGVLPSCRSTELVKSFGVLPSD